ncbi:MAG: VanZ family protein [Thermodesulfobacteriota bacterium]
MQALSPRNFCLYWLPPLLLSGGILLFSGNLGSSEHTKKLLDWVLSWLPFGEMPWPEQGQGLLRKIGHVTAYGSLSWLWFRALWRHLGGRLRTVVLFSLGLCLLIALLDEGHQSMMPSRTGSIWDVALDFGAAVLAALALSLKRA